jgi:hypothetical protein
LRQHFQCELGPGKSITVQTAAPLALPLAPAPLIADDPGPVSQRGLDYRLHRFLWLTAFTMGFIVTAAAGPIHL